MLHFYLVDEYGLYNFLNFKECHIITCYNNSDDRNKAFFIIFFGFGCTSLFLPFSFVKGKLLCYILFNCVYSNLFWLAFSSIALLTIILLLLTGHLFAFTAHMSKPSQLFLSFSFLFSIELASNFVTMHLFF